VEECQADDALGVGAGFDLGNDSYLGQEQLKLSGGGCLAHPFSHSFSFVWMAFWFLGVPVSAIRRSCICTHDCTSACGSIDSGLIWPTDVGEKKETGNGK